jgi:hypothetical protein
VSRRLTDALTALAARTYPRSRRVDAAAVRDCAREAIDASGARVLARESASLAFAGLRARGGVAARELGHAPWRAALSVLALPLATATVLLWTFGFVPRYDHWPLGEGWALLLGGSLLAVVGAALERRWLVVCGALATFVAAASPYLGFGTEVPGHSLTPSFFYGHGVDLAAASLVPTLLLAAAGWSLPRGARPPGQVVATRLVLALAPAVVAAIALLPASRPQPTYGWLYRGPGTEPKLIEGGPYSMPWLPPSRVLLVIFAVALAAALVLTWIRAREQPAPALASALVLASVAYPLVWATTRNTDVAPYWAYQGTYMWLASAIPLLIAVALARRAGRMRRAGELLH